MYHTQEKWSRRLKWPVICTRKNAWLGTAYYFWDDEADAVRWGENAKRGTGFYEIYKSDIDCNNILDTVFDENHYKFWLEQIDKAAKAIYTRTGQKATIKQLNNYLKDRADWKKDICGVLFQDLPKNQDLLVEGLPYRKRIQLAVYDDNIIKTFLFHIEGKCSNN